MARTSPEDRSLIDRQRDALAQVIADATRLQQSLAQAQTLGLVLPILPGGLTAKQRAVLGYVQACHPRGLSNFMNAAGSQEAMCLDLAVSILEETGVCMSDKTVSRTLTEWALMPSRQK